MAVNAPDTGDPSTSLGLFTGEQAGTSTPRVYCTVYTRGWGGGGSLLWPGVAGVGTGCGLVFLGWELVVACCFWGRSLLRPGVAGEGDCCGLMLLGWELVVAWC